uniref:COP9 signalosome complex subunit 8 n=1 Tax=Strigamia maritima TaxID=126957 RepID=T1J5K3_STRMM
MVASLASGDDYRKLLFELEKKELEAPSGIATAQVYEQMLALLLLQNDLCNAKYLWKRIPPAIKSGSSELPHIWAVGQQMWKRDYPGVYQALKREWADDLKQVMEAVAEATKLRAIHLVAQAYSSISVEDFAKFVGSLPEEAIGVAVQEGWVEDSASGMIVPKKPATPSTPIKPNEEQLAKLTEFVSFLEN